MFTISQITVLASQGTSVMITYDDGEAIKGTIPMYLLKSTAYPNRHEITFFPDMKLDENIITEYVRSKLRSLAVEMIDNYCSASSDLKLYKSLIILSQFLKDETMINDLIPLMFKIGPIDEFRNILSMFSTKELWKQCILQGDVMINFKDEKSTDYVNKLCSDNKYYNKYMDDLFEQVELESLEEFLDKELPKEVNDKFWKDYTDYQDFH